ncbi:MAG TPA: hypothetical protein VI457_03620 [Methylococcaceae bacterium]|nr:hypothetical protein [Methylococcaceae bacterium]
MIARGLKKNHRRDPGQVSLENYWQERRPKESLTDMSAFAISL